MNAESDTPHNGRVLAIDYGTRRLGFALSDPGQQFASPHANYTRISAAQDLAFMRSIIHNEQIVLIVVGLPVHLDGRESEKSAEARRFGEWIRRETGVPLVFHDERFTSVEAEHQLAAARLTRKRRQARRDMLAAQLLLSAYLESDRTGDSSGSLDDR